MKTARWLLLLALLAAPGCWALPPFLQPANPPPPAVVETPGSRGPVQPERVNANNAHQTADALREELDRAEKTGEW